MALLHVDVLEDAELDVQVLSGALKFRFVLFSVGNPAQEWSTAVV